MHTKKKAFRNWFAHLTTLSLGHIQRSNQIETSDWTLTNSKHIIHCAKHWETHDSECFQSHFAIRLLIVKSVRYIRGGVKYVFAMFPIYTWGGKVFLWLRTNSKVCQRPSGFECPLSLPVTQPSTPAPAGDSSAASRAWPRAIQKQRPEDPSKTGSPFPFHSRTNVV